MAALLVQQLQALVATVAMAVLAEVVVEVQV
jgi:hypothetical protein